MSVRVVLYISKLIKKTKIKLFLKNPFWKAYLQSKDFLFCIWALSLNLYSFYYFRWNTDGVIESERRASVYIWRQHWYVLQTRHHERHGRLGLYICKNLQIYREKYTQMYFSIKRLLSFATLRVFQYCALGPINSKPTWNMYSWGLPTLCWWLFSKTYVQIFDGINLRFIELREYSLRTIARNCHLGGAQKWDKGCRRVFRSKLPKSYSWMLRTFNNLKTIYKVKSCWTLVSSLR